MKPVMGDKMYEATKEVKFEISNKPDLNANAEGNLVFDPNTKTVSIQNNTIKLLPMAFTTYYHLASTMVHELYHAYQVYTGYANSLYHRYDKDTTTGILEYAAYDYTWRLGGVSQEFGRTIFQKHKL